VEAQDRIAGQVKLVLDLSSRDRLLAPVALVSPAVPAPELERLVGRQYAAHDLVSDQVGQRGHGITPGSLSRNAPNITGVQTPEASTRGPGWRRPAG